MPPLPLVPIILLAMAVTIYAFVRAAWLYKHTPKENLGRKKKQDKTANYQRRGVPPEIRALIDAITYQGQAGRAEEIREDRERQFREWLGISVIAGSLAVLMWQLGETIKVYAPIAQQAATADDMEKRELRAYVAISSYRFKCTFCDTLDLSKGLPDNIEPDAVDEVIIQNGGQTPAYNVRFAAC